MFSETLIKFQEKFVEIWRNSGVILYFWNFRNMKFEQSTKFMTISG